MKENFDEFKKFIKGKRTAVVGIGISNKPLIDFLLKLGTDVTAFDKKDENKLGEEFLQLKEKGVNLILGENYLDKLNGFDVIFKTPSMRSDNPVLLREKSRGAYITSEMQEFVRYCPAKIYGVTGSDGKTTTTTIIYKILSEKYKTWVGGNIGTPLFSKIENIKREDKVVLELSSFQLMSMRYSTDVAVVTNLSPNHLDIHKDMNEYINAKKNIFKYQNKNDLLILNKDNNITHSFKKEARGNVREFSTNEVIENGGYLKDNFLYVKGKRICNRNDIKLRGIHNVQNLLAAFCAVYDDVDIKDMKKVAETFEGVEHRCEFVREINGVKYFNDSIASSPTRTLAGLNAFEKPVILIAGGYDKKIPFKSLAEQGYKKIKTLILLGATKYKIKEAFDNVINEKGISVPIYMVNTLKEAAELAKKISHKGDIVTLSPACASFDMFSNFEERGNTFKNIVQNL